jgi:hypothetical protein
MALDRPDHYDAELVLKVYDLRREAVTRQSREALNAKFWPKTYADVQAVMKFEHPLNAAWRQMSGYWEMVYSLGRHGIVNPDFLIENNSEGLFLFAKIKPYLEQYRKDTSPQAFRNAEWISTQCDEGRRRLEMISVRVKKLTEQRP